MRTNGAAIVHHDDLVVVGQLPQRLECGDDEAGDGAAVVVGGKEEAEAGRPRRRGRRHAGRKRTTPVCRYQASLPCQSRVLFGRGSWFSGIGPASFEAPRQQDRLGDDEGGRRAQGCAAARGGAQIQFNRRSVI